MNSDHIKKIIAFFRYALKSFFFRRMGWKNFCYKNVYFKGYKKILIGQNNNFARHSNLIIDSFSNNQYIQLGDNNIISTYAILRSHGGSIKLGNSNFIGERAQIQGRGGVVIGDNCLIASNTFISSSNHNFEDPFAEDYLKKEVPKETLIDDFVWIGANCVVLAGVHIGHHSIIAGGTIVTKNISPYSMLAGNPGRVIKKFDKNKSEWVKVSDLNLKN